MCSIGVQSVCVVDPRFSDPSPVGRVYFPPLLFPSWLKKSTDAPYVEILNTPRVMLNYAGEYCEYCDARDA